jgi:DNA-binding IclR family transcriptional regulator
VLETTKVIFLAQVNAPTSVGLYVKPGSNVDIMEAATGYVILAHQDQEQRKHIVSAWARETGKKPPRDLARHLERIRKAGFEMGASYQVKGVVNISFPLLDSRGSALGAITAPCIQSSAGKIPLATVTESLRHAAAEITRAIGGKTTRIK